MSRQLASLLRERSSLEAGPRPMSYIWGGRDAEHAQLYVVCPNGCCVHGEFSSGAGIPEVWRYAVQSEVNEFAARVLAATDLRNQQLRDDDAGRTEYLS